MTTSRPLFLLSLLLLPHRLALAAPGGLVIAVPDDGGAAPRYAAMVQRVANMANDGRARELAARRRLDILNVLWEDTGRYQGSSVGPNISDVTIEVEMKDER